MTTVLYSAHRRFLFNVGLCVPTFYRNSTFSGSNTKRFFNLRRYKLSNSPNTAKNSVGDNVNGNGEQKLSLFKRFKAMYRDYWYVLVPVHVVTSCGWFGGFYQLSKSGVDLGYYMRKIGISEHLVVKVTESSMGHIAVAYALYKIATPARYTVTLGGTTLAIRYLRNMGYIKPAKEIISKGKDKLLKKKEQFSSKD